MCVMPAHDVPVAIKNDDTMKTNQRKIKCPTCGNATTWGVENPYKPFCSHRCKLIDLGEWASESRKIPGRSINPDNLQDSDDN